MNVKTIDKYWKAIQDRQWAIREALQRTASSAKGQNALLQAAYEEAQARLEALQPAGIDKAYPQASLQEIKGRLFANLSGDWQSHKR